MGRRLLRNLYCILGGLAIIALVFMPWVEDGGARASGLDTPVGSAVMIFGAVIAGMGIHSNFSRLKGVVVLVCGLGTVACTFLVAEVATVRLTTMWHFLALVIGLVTAVVGVSGIYLGKAFDYTQYSPDAE